MTACEDYYSLTHQIGDQNVADILNEIGGSDVKVVINDNLAQQVCASCLETIMEAIGLATEELDESEYFIEALDEYNVKQEDLTEDKVSPKQRNKIIVVEDTPKPRKKSIVAEKSSSKPAVKQEQSSSASFRCLFRDCTFEFDDLNQLNDHIHENHRAKHTIILNEDHEDSNETCIVKTEVEEEIEGEDEEYDPLEESDNEALESLQQFIQIDKTEDNFSDEDWTPQDEVKAEVQPRKRKRMTMAHGLKAKPFCEVCNRAFANGWEMQVHYDRMHNTERNFKCEISNCEQAFASRYLLIRHLESRHMMKYRKKQPKEISEEVLAYMAEVMCEYENELRGGDDDDDDEENPRKKRRRVMCDECDRNFCSRSELRVHKDRMHANREAI